jgi:D-alanyl-D-alanine dipeptidase
LRYKAAKDLVAASDKFKTMGYRLKVFDCYRPLSAQYVLWEIMPNINYVANPEKGSIHNRGAAVDVTIVDKNGKDVDISTPYDYFGVLAYSTNLNLPDTILQNRRLFWNVLNSCGFKEIKTEWWHLSHFSCLEFEISNTQLPCE